MNGNLRFRRNRADQEKESIPKVKAQDFHSEEGWDEFSPDGELEEEEPPETETDEIGYAPLRTITHRTKRRPRGERQQ